MVEVKNHVSLINDQNFRVFIEAAPDAILVIDSQGFIVIQNSLAEQMFKYDSAQLVNKTLEFLVPERYRSRHGGYVSQYFENPRTRPMGQGRSLSGLKSDGSEFPIEVSLSPVKSDDKLYVISIIRDITERKKVEEQLQANLREKEVLLKEIHHRVKNNLQVTSSLLRLQYEKIENPETKEMFVESQRRIRSMALIHEKLYQSNDISKINFNEYLLSLGQILLSSFGVTQNTVEILVNGDIVNFSIEMAVPCGLIINEVISNCLKHAFAEKKTGKILIQIQSLKESVIISVCDNGVGFPSAFDFENSSTLGLRLVKQLSKQVDGIISFKNENGACVELKLPGVNR